MNRWSLGLLAAFGIVLAVNGYMLWLALDNPPSIDPVYEQERNAPRSSP